MKKVIIALCVLVVWVAAFSKAEAGIVVSDLDHYWRLDGNLNDSVGALNGTLEDRDGGGDNTSWVAGFNGVAGTALDLEGTDDYVSTAFDVGSGAKSVSFFFTISSDTDNQVFVGVHGNERFYVGFDIVYNDSLDIGMGDATDGTAPSTEYSPTAADVSVTSAYHHVVLTDDGAGNFTVYYRAPDGATQHSSYASTYSGSTGGGTDGFTIGVVGSSTYSVSGKIDDVAVFNRVLTKAEAESIWDEGSVQAVLPPTLTKDDLDHYWKLDGNLNDSVGTLNGTLEDIDGGGDNTSWVAGFNGVAGTALDLEGTTDYISTPLTPGAGAKSVSLFFTVSSDAFGQIFAGAHRNERFYVGAYINSGKPTIGVGGLTDSTFPSTEYTPTASDISVTSAYHHVVLTDDGVGNFTVYYRAPDGLVHSSYTSTYTGDSGGDDSIFGIGGMITGGGAASLFASGKIDDVAIFNRVLTALEAESIYEYGSALGHIPPKGTLIVIK